VESRWRNRRTFGAYPFRLTTGTLAAINREISGVSADLVCLAFKKKKGTHGGKLGE
jgi:hypothetical protein